MLAEPCVSVSCNGFVNCRCRLLDLGGSGVGGGGGRAGEDKDVTCLPQDPKADTAQRKEYLAEKQALYQWDTTVSKKRHTHVYISNEKKTIPQRVNAWRVEYH